MEKIVEVILRWGLPAVTAFAIFLFSQVLSLKDDIQKINLALSEYRKIGEIELEKTKECASLGNRVIQEVKVLDSYTAQAARDIFIKRGCEFLQKNVE
ncbi:hypothetical protein [Magnetospirillum molischianum]|nr:hypothetical protein [Magnetospirillum molischianum]